MADGARRGQENPSLQRPRGAACRVARGGGEDVGDCGAFGIACLLLRVLGSAEWPGLAGELKGLHIAKRKAKSDFGCWC